MKPATVMSLLAIAISTTSFFWQRAMNARATRMQTIYVREFEHAAIFIDTTNPPVPVAFRLGISTNPIPADFNP